MAFLAQYRGECADCGGELKGRMATYDMYDELVHVQCDGQPGDVSVGTGAVCAKCFCLHAGDC